MNTGNTPTRLPGRRGGRWLVVGCLLAASAACFPWARRQASFYSHVRAARYALTRFFADNAVTELNLAKDLRPDSAEVQFLLGMANREAGHIDDVREHLENAMRLGWPKKDVRFQLTLLAFQAGDRNAEVELKQMMLRPMDDHTAEQLYEALSLGYLAEYRASDAMMVLDHWVRWRPNCVRPRLLRAEVYDITNNSVKIEEEFRKILEVEPENYSAHLGLAHVLQRNHDTVQAQAHFRFCHRQWPDDPVATTGIASCLKHEGKMAEARQVLNEMLKEKYLPRPQRAAALSALGELAEQERDVATAIKLLTEAVELDPYNSQWHYRLGVCLAKSGRKDEAQRYTERAAEIDRLLERRSELELEMLDRPDDAELRYEIGEVLLKLGFPKPSAAMMLSALRWDPGHQGAHAALAKYYEEIDRDDLAQKHRTLVAPDEQRGEKPKAEGQDAADSSVVRGPSSVALSTDN